MGKFCRSCGKQLEDGEKFCSRCGTKCSGEAPVQAGKNVGNVPGGNQPYGSAPGKSQPYGDMSRGSQPYGNMPGGNQPYGNMPGGNQPYGNMPGGNQFYGNGAYGNASQRGNIGNNAASGKIGVIIAAVAMAVSTFLPFATASFMGYSESITLMSNEGEMRDGIFFIIAGLLTVLFVCLSKKIPTLIFGILSLGLAVFEIIDLNSKLGMDLGYGITASSVVNRGIGFYLMAVSAAALCIFSIIYFVQMNKRIN